MTRETVGSVDEESRRLKELLRGSRGHEAPEPGERDGAPEPGEREPRERDEPDPAPHAPDGCPVCRASRLAHALAPELIDEVGRGMEALGRSLRAAATAARRHTDEHLHGRTDEERG